MRFLTFKAIANMHGESKRWVGEIVLNSANPADNSPLASEYFLLWRSEITHEKMEDAEAVAVLHLEQRLKALLNPSDPQYAGGP